MYRHASTQESCACRRLHERVGRLQREDLGPAASAAHAEHGGARLRDLVRGLVQVQRLRDSHRVRGQEHQAVGRARPRQRAHLPPRPHVSPHPAVPFSICTSQGIVQHCICPSLNSSPSSVPAREHDNCSRESPKHHALRHLPLRKVHMLHPARGNQYAKNKLFLLVHIF